MKKIQNLGRVLNKQEKKYFQGGVYDEGACEVWSVSGTNTYQGSTTCDYYIKDFAGNFIRFECEVSCLYGNSTMGYTFTRC